ncbi:hypothetical protein DSECCO2_293040 [anaerobic digester metagenome]
MRNIYQRIRAKLVIWLLGKDLELTIRDTPTVPEAARMIEFHDIGRRVTYGTWKVVSSRKCNPQGCELEHVTISKRYWLP